MVHLQQRAVAIGSDWRCCQCLGPRLLLSAIVAEARRLVQAQQGINLEGVLPQCTNCAGRRVAALLR